MVLFVLVCSNLSSCFVHLHDATVSVSSKQEQADLVVGHRVLFPFG